MPKHRRGGNKGRVVTMVVEVKLRSREEYLFFYYKYPSMLRRVDLLCEAVNTCDVFPKRVVDAGLEEMYLHVFADSEETPACEHCRSKLRELLLQRPRLPNK